MIRVPFTPMLRRAARRFGRDSSGNIAVLFAIALIPILTFVGAAVDYSRKNAAQSSMQAALDSTSLMLSRDLTQGTITTADLTTAANKYFSALYTSKDAATPTLAVTYTTNTSTGQNMALTASSAVTSDFMQIVGFPTLGFTAASTATWGNVKMRVALVLDNTGSMKDDGKLTALQNAVAGTGGLIDQLSNLAKTAGDVYISVIPFAKVVNVGTSNVGQSWIDWTDWANSPTVQPANGSFLAQIPNGSKFTATEWANTGPGSACPFTKANGFPTISGSVYSNSVTFTCQATSTNYLPPNPSSGSMNNAAISTIPSSGNICPTWDAASHTYYNGCWDSVASGSAQLCTGSSCSCSSAPNSSCTCSGSGSKKACSYTTYSHTWRPSNTSTWTGCVTDRSQPNDATNVSPTASDVTTLYPANQHGENNYAYCSDASATQLEPVIPLSYNWTALKTAINAMQPTGGTNQAVGLSVGVQSLTPGGMLNAPAEDPNTTYNRVVILLSDGLNTEDRWPDNGNGSSQASGNPIDARQALLCSNLKSAKDSKGNAMYTIYTIQVDTSKPADPTSTVLQNCASSPDNFFMLTSSTQILATFQTIGTALSKLRVAK